jgi:hypothetical protein
MSLFERRLPALLQSLLFVIVLLLGLGMILAGWFGWTIVRDDANVSRLRRGMALLSISANTLAIAIPFLEFSYFEGVSGSTVAALCLACSCCGVIAGVIAPREIRLPSILAGVTIGSIILAIPIGIL